MRGCSEIIGVRKLALYVNNDVRFNFPDPSIENEVDIIAHADGSFIISDVNEQITWQRELNNSGNYKINYIDTFNFLLHGILNNVPEILRDLRNNRKGYVAEIITTGGNSFVFPAPVFLNTENTKEINSHSWNVSLSYRVPTFQDYYTKLNTILMTNSFILGGQSTIISGGSNNALVGN